MDFGDQCSEKLLANADRWADSSIISRDLIDLAILRNKGVFPKSAISKAENAYPIISELKKALAKFLGDETYQRKCFNALEIKNQEFILEGIHLINKDFPDDTSGSFTSSRIEATLGSNSSPHFQETSVRLFVKKNRKFNGFHNISQYFRIFARPKYYKDGSRSQGPLHEIPTD